jgi:UrcA family protein
MVLPAAASANPFAADSAKIRTDDLDLARPADQKRLKMRLTEAAITVCGRDMDLIHNAAKDKARSCRDQVLAEGMARYDQRVAQAQAQQTLALK